MELSFLLAALRRRPWLVLPFVFLGMIPGVLAQLSERTMFNSTSVLLVSPPSVGVGGPAVNDVERYVSTQIAVLRTIGGRVAEEVKVRPITGGDVFNMVKFKHKEGTDVVEIAVESEDPELARAVAAAYADLYMADLRARSVGAQSAEIAQLDAKLGQIVAEIEEVDAALASKLPDVAARANLSLETVDPILASRRAQLASEHTLVLANKNQLEQNAKLKITSEVVQYAPPASQVSQAKSAIALVAGAFAGAILGLVAAVMAARLSATLLDDVHAEEVLGMPVPHSLPYAKSLLRDPISAVTSLPPQWVASVDHICVRAESAASIGETLTMVVCGTERGAGATTLALALAGRFAVQGSRVILIDADVRDAGISHAFETPITGGLDELLSDRSRRVVDLLVPSPTEGLRILGLGSRRRQLRRDDVPVLLSAVQHEADVVIIDGGSVLESAATLQLTHVVEAVVLAVPGQFQRIDSLDVVGRQLKSPRVMLLPVITEPRRPRLFVLPTFRPKISYSYTMPQTSRADRAEVRPNPAETNRQGLLMPDGVAPADTASTPTRPRSRQVAPDRYRREAVAVDENLPRPSGWLEDDDLDALRRSSLRRFRQ